LWSKNIGSANVQVVAEKELGTGFLPEIIVIAACSRATLPLSQVAFRGNTRKIVSQESFARAGAMRVIWESVVHTKAISRSAFVSLFAPAVLSTVVVSPAFPSEVKDD
jgi:hypothetical protein